MIITKFQYSMTIPPISTKSKLLRRGRAIKKNVLKCRDFHKKSKKPTRRHLHFHIASAKSGLSNFDYPLLTIHSIKTIHSDKTG